MTLSFFKKNKESVDMKYVKIDQEEWKRLLPNGLPFPSSTLISGPGGSGKPLIGFAIVNKWLKSGGNVIFIPIQYPKTTFLKTSLKRIYNIDIKDYEEQTTFIEFTPEVETYEKTDEHTFKANLLKTQVWQKILIEAGQSMTPGKELGTLVFASALNILLFSPTYRKECLSYLEQLLKEDHDRSYLFSASTSAFREEIRRWENAAENLLFTRMGEEMTLYMHVEKLQHKTISSEETRIPMNKEMLKDIKEIAEHTRTRRIPQLKKI
jgi:archaellum biogenesis ATPase FlaH